MPNPTQVQVPTLTADEVMQSANGLAAYAKKRFLEGFADDAHALATRAAHLIGEVDQAASKLLLQLADRFASHAPPAGVVPPGPMSGPVAAPPAAVLRTDGPTPEEWVTAGYKMENYPPAGYLAKPVTPKT